MTFACILLHTFCGLCPFWGNFWQHVTKSMQGVKIGGALDPANLCILLHTFCVVCDTVSERMTGKRLQSVRCGCGLT